jgi:glycosyltransferase involved in cell wall biosynthesis
MLHASRFSVSLQPFELLKSRQTVRFFQVNLVLALSNIGCNGAVMYARRLAPLLAARGHRVWLAAQEDSWIAKATQGEIPLFPTKFSRWPLSEVDRVGAFCRQEGIQIFHSHLTRASHFGALLKVRHGVHSVAHLHANHPQLHAWFHDRVLAVSQDTLTRHRYYLAGLGKRGAVLVNFVDPKQFYPTAGRSDALRALLQVPAATPVVVVLGEICSRKGQDLAVEAWPDVLRTHPNAQLVCIGKGSLPDSLLHARGVTLLSHRNDIPELLPHATICLVPSRDEPFGLAAIEAMACGVPVVASAVSGLADVVAEGAGASYPASDTQALSRILTELLSDTQARANLAAVGLDRTHRLYSPAVHLAELERHYAEVLGLK